MYKSTGLLAKEYSVTNQTIQKWIKDGKFERGVSKKPKADITASGLKNQLSLLSTPVFLAQNQKVHWLNKKNYLEENTQTQDLYLTLPRDLTKIDEDIKPFWNSLSTAIHCTLWQPHQIELPEAVLPLSSGLSNYRVDESNFWKSQIIPKRSNGACDVHNLIPKHLSLSLPASSTPTTEKEAQSVITSKKIRIYPETK